MGNKGSDSNTDWFSFYDNMTVLLGGTDCQKLGKTNLLCVRTDGFNQPAHMCRNSRSQMSQTLCKWMCKSMHTEKTAKLFMQRFSPIFEHYVRTDVTDTTSFVLFFRTVAPTPTPRLVHDCSQKTGRMGYKSDQEADTYKPILDGTQHIRSFFCFVFWVWLPMHCIGLNKLWTWIPEACSIKAPQKRLLEFTKQVSWG